MAETKAAQNNASRRRLVALDDDDLAVISAHVQDAAVVAGDILWRQAEQRLVIAMRQGEVLLDAREELLGGTTVGHDVVDGTAHAADQGGHGHRGAHHPHEVAAGGAIQRGGEGGHRCVRAAV